MDTLVFKKLYKIKMIYILQIIIYKCPFLRNLNVI